MAESIINMAEMIKNKPGDTKEMTVSIKMLAEQSK
jgi:hypothetical protein